MRILVTNDDGVRAPGIAALARALANEHDVTVVAPAVEQSGVGHGFTFLTPLMSKRVDAELGFGSMRAYAVSGTPVDCVKLGCYHLGEDCPDFVFSGINCGANLGTDVLYSGTASAALEAAMLGIPAVAVSCESFTPSHYDSAAQYALELLHYLLEHPMPPLTMINLNVPDLPYDQIRGLMPARLAHRRYDNRYDTRVDPRGGHYFWLNDTVAVNKGGDTGEDTDERWEHQGFATITPVGIDLTRFDALAAMRTHPRFAESLRVRDALTADSDEV